MQKEQLTATTCQDIVVLLSAIPSPQRLERIDLFPNPTTANLSINIPKGLSIQNIELRSIDGRLLQQLHSEDVIDLSNYKGEIYLVKIMSSEGTSVA